MDSNRNFFQIKRITKKLTGGDGSDLTPLESLLNYYMTLQSNYGWTIQQIDDTEINILLAQMVIMSKKDKKQQQTYIDDIL